MLRDGADEWYARGDGTTVVFFSEERLRERATAAGFDVESLAEGDHRLVVNRATQTKMRRVWVAGVFRKPGAPPTRRRRGATGRCHWHSPRVQPSQFWP